jgi:hypothetical protein
LMPGQSLLAIEEAVSPRVCMSSLPMSKATTLLPAPQTAPSPQPMAAQEAGGPLAMSCATPVSPLPRAVSASPLPGVAHASPLPEAALASLLPGVAPASPPPGAASASPLPGAAHASPLPEAAPALPLPGAAHAGGPLVGLDAVAGPPPADGPPSTAVWSALFRDMTGGDPASAPPSPPVSSPVDVSDVEAGSSSTLPASPSLEEPFSRDVGCYSLPTSPS